MSRGIKGTSLGGYESASTNNTPDNGAPLFVLSKSFTGATSYSIPAPCPLKVVDVHCTATATSGGGTVQVKNGTTALHTAIACATDGAITRAAAGWDDTQMAFDRAENINFSTNAAADSGILYVVCVRVDG